MDKNEYIQNLKKVKLVLGNGFDLHCKLKTKYKHYFESMESFHNYLKGWIDEFTPRSSDYLRINVENHKDFWVEFKYFDKANIWDVFFYLVSREKDNEIKNWNWCDIESVILEWFRPPEQYFNTTLCWDNVYNVMIGRNIFRNPSDVLKILASFAFKKNNEKMFMSEKNFYVFLLEELKLFERNFGQYIYKQFFQNIDFGVINYNYYLYADKTISLLCNEENVVSIDSFNYGNCFLDKFKNIFRNINGNIDRPIFGIDSDKFKSPDIKSIFSKTNRRMENDMFDTNIKDNVDFENVIVFGHSLNQADYSYFFAVFDYLDITNFSKNPKIVFVYSIFNESQRETLKSNYRAAIFKLFQEYAIYKGNANHPNRLLDSLTTQGKILMYEIPNELF